MSERERLVNMLENCRDLAAVYDKIPNGGFGAARIRNKIEQGEKALASNNEPWMQTAADTLAECK